MDTENYEKIDKRNLRFGGVYLAIFTILIAGGIIAKRVYNYPEYMMLFHGPAAIFLVLGGLKITAKQRRNFSDINLLHR